jgi:hypothetical protein
MRTTGVDEVKTGRQVKERGCSALRQPLFICFIQKLCCIAPAMTGGFFSGTVLHG